MKKLVQIDHFNGNQELFIKIMQIDLLSKQNPGFPGKASGKEPLANAGDIREVGYITELGRSLVGNHDNPLSYFFLIYLYYLEANYFTILQWFLPYIDMNQPWIYMYSPSRSQLPPPSLPDPSGSSQCTRSERLSHASNLGRNFISI